MCGFVKRFTAIDLSPRTEKNKSTMKMKMRKCIPLLLTLSLWGAMLLTLGLSAAPASALPTTGVYRLTTLGQPGMCLDIVGFGNGNETRTQLWYANHTSNQQWLIEKQSDGSYKIYAYAGMNSFQMLDLTNGSAANGTQVNTYQDNGNSAQRWYFVPTSNGYYRIVPQNAGTGGAATLEITSGNSAVAGATADVWEYWGGANQQWKLDYAGPQQILPNKKKGMAVGGHDTKATAMHLSWFYNWGSTRPTDVPANVEYVPMDWGYYGGDSTGFLTWAAGQRGVSNVLAFNEPDHTDQANLSVASALQGYSYHSNFGTKNPGIGMGSPACADDTDDWMYQFMSQATSPSLNYKIDFVCVHCYQTDPSQFMSYLSWVHWLYNKPLWVTEFAPADWSGKNGVSVAAATAFMETVCPLMNNTDYVARYAWYGGASPSDGTLGSSSLFNSDGTLSALGKIYARM